MESRGTLKGFLFCTMTRTNNFDVKGWMVIDLNLKGNELMAFAIVHGFSQDGESEFKGSISYLMKFLSVSKPTASKILNSLYEKGLIEKRKVISEKGKRNFFKTSIGVVKKLNQGGKETLLGGGKETLPMNIHIENKQGNNINGKDSLNNSLEIDFEENQTKEVYDWPEPKKDWQLLWNEWIEYRAREKKPKFKTEKSENIAKNKLVKDSGGVLKIAVEMVETSIANNYQGLFKPKNSKNGNTSEEIRKLAGF